MRTPRPRLVILAGPNGAGKSTVGPWLLRETLLVTEFVNADVIAQGLSAFNPAAVGIAAGRVMLKRIDELTWSSCGSGRTTWPSPASQTAFEWVAMTSRKGQSGDDMREASRIS